MSARARTIAHMQKLVALSATAVAASLACGKDRGYAVVDPMPAPPPKCFDPSGTVKTTLTPSGPSRVTVSVELLPHVETISFSNASLGGAHAYRSSGGDRLEVGFDLREKSARRMEFEVDVPEGATTYVTLTGLECEQPNAHAIEITLSRAEAGAVPVLNLSGASYGY